MVKGVAIAGDSNAKIVHELTDNGILGTIDCGSCLCLTRAVTRLRSYPCHTNSNRIYCTQYEPVVRGILRAMGNKAVFVSA